MTLSLDWSPLWLSLRVASLATLAAALIGIAVGYALAEGRWRGRDLVEAVTTLPLILPPTVLGFYLLIALGRRSVLGVLYERVTGAPLVFTWQAAVVAATVASVPYVIRTSRAAFEQVDTSSLEAARIDGATRLQRFAFVLLPLARRSVTAGIALAFARALGEFGATLMVAGSIPERTRTMPLAIYDAVQAGAWDLARFLVLLLTIVALAVLLIVGRFSPRL